MNMNCSRDHSSERKQKILPWITMIIGLTLTTFVVILLTQLINLSRNVDVSRRTLSEMSGRLQKIQKENDEMKKELRNTKSKIEKLLRRFPSPQKVITREVDNGKLCFKIAVYMHNIFPCIG